MLAYRAIMALRHNIILDISPPDAHLATSIGFFPVEENRNLTASEPDAPTGASTSSTSNTALSSSRNLIDFSIASAKGFRAFMRLSCNFAAISPRAFSPSSSDFDRRSRSSSRAVESYRASERVSRWAISSATVRQPCFFMRSYSRDILSSTCSRRSWETSVEPSRAVTSESMSSISSLDDSSLAESSFAGST